MKAIEEGQIGPLAGIRVIELGSLIAGPFAARMLAEFGAEVIKIESKEGDALRTWRMMHDGTSLWWRVQARNKLLVSLNLKMQDGVQIVKRLVREADVVIENFRPGTLEKMGLGWDVLSAENPNLVMVRISGYGQTGPYSERPGFGAIGEALGGIRYTTGTPDRPPSRVGVSLGDSLASLHAVIGALMCLLRVKQGKGSGQVVDVSLFESVFNLMESLVPEFSHAGFVRERSGGKLPGICPSNTYKTCDGWLVIAGNGDAIYRRLMNAIAREDLAEDPQLRTNDGRVAAESIIDEAIASWSSSHSTEAALEILRRADVPCDRIYSVADMINDPQFRARQTIVDAALPDGNAILVPGVFPKLSATPGSQRWLGGDIGQNTKEILSRCGLNEAEISDLFERGVAR